MVSRLHLTDDGNGLYFDPTQYRSIVGALRYLRFTRPDIQYDVNQVCQYMHQPLVSQFTTVKRILRYLNGTMNYGLNINGGLATSLTVYAATDWAACPTTHRSTSGFCLFLGSTMVSWSSKKQAMISRSRAEDDEQVAKGVLKVSYIPIAYQLADFFTKSLTTARFQLLCSNLDVGDPLASIAGG
ncbi:hypothetical protein LIER_36567 [Lithospermum erythrorhizon]|uniref:Mitochondrial protein n=1 Tax=Lithospermum erythrorhizon TaxID=34254 RepID=A0AAV3P9E8_LITER